MNAAISVLLQIRMTSFNKRLVLLKVVIVMKEVVGGAAGVDDMAWISLGSLFEAVCRSSLQKKVRLRFGGTGGPPTYDHDLSGHSKTTEVATLISFFHHLPYHRF